MPVGVGLAQHAGAGVVLDALDGGLGRHAAPDRLLHAPQPAAIVREHAVGFQHLAMLAGGAQLALLQHLVDGGLQLVDRGFQPGGLRHGILGLELGDDHARLVQHGVAERDAFRHRLAAHHMADGAAELGAGVDAGNGARHQVLGQHHSRRLQHLHVLVGIFLLRLVLDGQHAQHIAAAQHRHRQEGVVDFLARFGPIGESRMVLRVRLVDGHGQLGTAPDQTLTPLEQRVVHGAGIEALGGEQLQRAVMALQVDGGHLGDHQAGDLAHDLVEAGLAVGRLGHDLPQPAHDDAQRRLGRSDPGFPAYLLHHPIRHSGANVDPDASAAGPQGLMPPPGAQCAAGGATHDCPAKACAISLCPARTGRAGCARPARRRPHRSAR